MSDSYDPVHLAQGALAAAESDRFNPARSLFILADYICCGALFALMVDDIGGETVRAELSFKILPEQFINQGGFVNLRVIVH